MSFLWGGSSKYLQHVSLHFQGPPKNTLKSVAYILGTSSHLKNGGDIIVPNAASYLHIGTFELESGTMIQDQLGYIFVRL